LLISAISSLDHLNVLLISISDNQRKTMGDTLADIADMAQEQIERILAKSLKDLRKPALSFSGSCLACGDPLSQRRFCDSDCREVYETSLRARMVIAGRIPTP
jgi:hypothetical protein